MVNGEKIHVISEFPEMREKFEDQMELHEVYKDDVMSIGVSLKF